MEELLISAESSVLPSGVQWVSFCFGWFARQFCVCFKEMLCDVTSGRLVTGSSVSDATFTANSGSLCDPSSEETTVWFTVGLFERSSIQGSLLVLLSELSLLLSLVRRTLIPNVPWVVSSFFDLGGVEKELTLSCLRFPRSCVIFCLFSSNFPCVSNSGLSLIFERRLRRWPSKPGRQNYIDFEKWNEFTAVKIRARLASSFYAAENHYDRKRNLDAETNKLYQIPLITNRISALFVLQWQYKWNIEVRKSLQNTIERYLGKKMRLPI